MPRFKFYIVFGLSVALEIGIISQLVNLFKRIPLEGERLSYTVPISMMFTVRDNKWCSQKAASRRK